MHLTAFCAALIFEKSKIHIFADMKYSACLAHANHLRFMACHPRIFLLARLCVQRFLIARHQMDRVEFRIITWGAMLMSGLV